MAFIDFFIKDLNNHVIKFDVEWFNLNHNKFDCPFIIIYNLNQNVKSVLNIGISQCLMELSLPIIEYKTILKFQLIYKRPMMKY